MKQLNLFSILFTLTLILLAPYLAVAMLDEEANKIFFQVNNSDRIMIGTVSGIYPHYNYSIITITVEEWIYNPLPIEVIKVRIEIGTNVAVEDKAAFTKNESVLLMLNDINLDEHLCRAAIGEPGKHPVSDRDAVIEELKAQGKWQDENQKVNKTNETKKINNIKITGSQKENITENKAANTGKEVNIGIVGKQQTSSSSTQKSKRAPFISVFCMFAIVSGTVMYIRETK